MSSILWITCKHTFK